MLRTISRLIVLLAALFILFPPGLSMGEDKKDNSIKEDVKQLAKDTKKAVKKSGPVIKKTAVKVGKDIKEGFKEVKKDLKDKKE